MSVKNYLEVHVDGPVLMVGLNRPQKRNAMSLEVMHELRDTFSNLPEGIGAAVLYSTSQHFCTGLDLSEIRDQSVIDNVQAFREWHKTFELIQFGKVPVVAAITGAAIGGGLEIATACSLRVVDDSAFFSLPEAMRGLYVGVGASVRFPRIAGIALMTDMMLTGRTLYAKESYERGVAQYLVPVGQAVLKATELAHKIAGNLPMTNYAVTHVLPRIVDQSQQDGLMTEALIAAVVSSDTRTQDRLADFLDRKKDKIQTTPEVV